MRLNVVCEKCKKEFVVGGGTIGGVKVRQKAIHTSASMDGKKLMATTFKCPACGYEHFVQLDDEYTQDLLAQTINLLRTKVVLERQGKHVNKQQKRRFKEIRTAMTTYRYGLMTKYNGTLCVDEETGDEFELRCVTSVVGNATEVKGGEDENGKIYPKES